MRRLLAALFVAAVALLGAGIGVPAAGSPLLGLVSVGAESQLVRTDPQTLVRLPGRAVGVGSGGCASRAGGEACWAAPPWTFSPDGRRLAFARNDRWAARSVRLVDVERLRVSAEIRLRGGPIGALAWLSPRRILALQEDSGKQSLLAVDLDRRRVTTRRGVGGSVMTLARTPSEFVLLVARPDAIGPASLVVADSRGAMRSVRLGRVLAGVKLRADSSAHAVDHRSPGLAIDPRRRRAYVVGPSLVAEVDLATLAVTYHELGGLRQPAARTKTSTGFFRRAQWLAGGLLAVSGSDSKPPRTVPAGLALVDTRSWRLRTLDRGAWEFVVHGELVLATGATGLAVYGLDGRRRFALFDGLRVFVTEVVGGRAYVAVGGREPIEVVDLAGGEPIGSRRVPLPRLLDGPASSWWE